MVYFTQDKIIMAADSRTLVAGENTAPDDSKCKIVAIYGQVAFGFSHGTGYTAEGPRDPVQSCTNAEEARRAYDKICGLSPNCGRVEEIAKEWGRAISLHFQSLYFAYPRIAEAIAGGDNGILTMAFFGGEGMNGNLVLFQTSVVLNENNIQPVRFVTWKVPSCPLLNYCSIGEVEVLVEFVNLTTPRAKEEAKNWNPSSLHNPADYDLLKTVRLVDLTIAYHQGRDVGGPIDAVQLNRDGSLRWFQRKENCPAN
jgi:hypothetical protein